MSTIHCRHLRHGRFERLRYSNNMLGFLSTQADRLSATSEELDINAQEVHELLKSKTAEQIANTAELADL